MNWKNIAIMVGDSVGHAFIHAAGYGLMIGLLAMFSHQYAYVYVAFKIFSIFFSFMLAMDIIWYGYSAIMYKKYKGENIKKRFGDRYDAYK